MQTLFLKGCGNCEARWSKTAFVFALHFWLFGLAAPAWALPLDLNGIAEALLRNNTEIRSAALDCQTATAQLLSADGDFDPIFQITPETKTDYKLSKFIYDDPFWIESADSISVAAKKKFPIGLTSEASWQAIGIQSTSTQSLLPKRTQSGVKFSLRQPLLRGGWQAANLFETRKTEAQVLEYRARFEELVQAKYDEVSSLYWDLVSDDHEVSARKAAVKKAEGALEAIRRRCNSGTATRLDTLKAESALALAEAGLEAAFGQRKNDEDRLLKEIIAPTEPLPGELMVQTEPLPLTDPELQTFEDVPNTPPPAVASLQAQTAAARAALEKAKNAMLPRLDVDLSFSSVGMGKSLRGATTDVATFENPSWNAAVSLSLPLYHLEPRGNRQASQAQIDRLESEATRERVRQSHEARLLEQELKLKQNRLSLLRQNSELAHEKVLVSEKFLRAGRISSLDFFDNLSAAADSESAFAREYSAFRQVELKARSLRSTFLRTPEVQQTLNKLCPVELRH
ncbi:MAG TPA: TolC family protein [Bdellovibrionota bacterium]|nr:TolC family protein [Bdellovibrionota bacterium]